MGDAKSLHQIGTSEHENDLPYGGEIINEEVYEFSRATEATKLLGPQSELRASTRSSRSIHSAQMDPEAEKKEKKKLRTWLIRFGIISCILILIVTGIALAAVYMSNHRENIFEGCVINFDPEFDYFPQKALEFHFGLTVQYYTYYKVVRIGNGPRYIEYQCGTPEPTGYIGARDIAVPVHYVALDQQTPTTFIEMLNKRLNVKFMGQTESIVSPCFQKLIEASEIQRLSENTDERNQQISTVDGVFSPKDETQKFFALTAASTAHPRDNAIVWLQFIGSFFNFEARSNEVATQISTNYDCHREKLLTYLGTGTRPLVAWINYDVNSSGNETWTISKAKSNVAYSEDAGAQALELFRENYVSYPDFHSALEGVDYVIDQSSISSWSIFLSNYRFDGTTFPFIVNGQVWKYDKIQNANGGLDWFEGGIAEPDAALVDLISIFHPTHLSTYVKDYQRIWFRRLYLDEDPIIVKNSASCKKTTEEYILRGAVCH